MDRASCIPTGLKSISSPSSTVVQPSSTFVQLATICLALFAPRFTFSATPLPVSAEKWNLCDVVVRAAWFERSGQSARFPCRDSLNHREERACRSGGSKAPKAGSGAFGWANVAGQGERTMAWRTGRSRWNKGTPF